MGLLKKGIHRRYLRLCRLQGELAGLDLQKATPGVSLEDFVFSRIDFLRYREMEDEYFETLFLEGLKDFDGAFFKEKFYLDKEEIQSLIETSYQKTEGVYKIQRENSMILAVMRTLETSLEDLPLFTPDEINEEMKKLPYFVEEGKIGIITGEEAPEAMSAAWFPFLVSSLDGVVIAHEGVETKLIVSTQGDLEGIFLPDNKPWTRILIPTNQSASSRPTTPGQD